MNRFSRFQTIPRRGLEFATYRSSRFGERHGLDWLTYGPLQILAYDRLGRADAPAVFDAIEDVFPGRRQFADVGAGSGVYAVEAIGRGFRVEACEYSTAGRLLHRLRNIPTSRLDLDDDPPAKLTGPFDIAYCFEVAEHCSPAHGDRLVRYLAHLAPLVLFTAARPGQGGLGHINEQEPGYWVERFERYGAVCNRNLSGAMRDAMDRRGVSAPWLRENLIVFRCAEGEARKALADPAT